MPTGYYKQTEESNKKRSEALKGRIITWGDKISASKIGKKRRAHSEETKRKMSLAHKGKMPKNLSLINANKFGENNPMWRKGYKITGEKAPNWKGGVTPFNRAARNATKIWKRSIKEIFNNTCQKCGEKNGKLVAHHIQNFSEVKELRTSLENGICLCETCHIEFHKKYGKYRNNRIQLQEYLDENKKTKIQN